MSVAQPPGIVQVLFTHVRMSEQSASLPHSSQGRHRPAVQLQAWLQSASLAQLAGWQYCHSQRSPLGHSASVAHSGATKQMPSAHVVPGGHSALEPGIVQNGNE